MHKWRPTDAAKTYVITAREKYGVSYRKDWVLGDRAPPGLEQRFKNPQPASSQDFLDPVFANSALDQPARHVSRVGMIGHLPAE